MVVLENIDIDIDIDMVILQNIDIDKISNRFKFGLSNRAIAAGTKETDKSFLKGQNVCKTLQLFKTPISWLEKFGKGNFKQELLSKWRKQLLGISKATILVFLHEWGGCTVLLQHSILILIQGGHWPMTMSLIMIKSIFSAVIMMITVTIIMILTN